MPIGIGLAPERPQIVNRVSAAARNNLRFAMIQDQDRRFARDARNFAVDKYVSHQVAKDDNALA